MIWSTLLCRIGKHRLTQWRRALPPALVVQERHCKRAGCKYRETRAPQKRTPAQRKRQLREATGADTTQPKGQQ